MHTGPPREFPSKRGMKEWKANPWLCKKCGKKFLTASDLYRHQGYTKNHPWACGASENKPYYHSRSPGVVGSARARAAVKTIQGRSGRLHVARAMARPAQAFTISKQTRLKSLLRRAQAAREAHEEMRNTGSCHIHISRRGRNALMDALSRAEWNELWELAIELEAKKSFAREASKKGRERAKWKNLSKLVKGWSLGPERFPPELGGLIKEYLGDKRGMGGRRQGGKKRKKWKRPSLLVPYTYSGKEVRPYDSKQQARRRKVERAEKARIQAMRVGRVRKAAMEKHLDKRSRSRALAHGVAYLATRGGTRKAASRRRKN